MKVILNQIVTIKVEFSESPRKTVQRKTPPTKYVRNMPEEKFSMRQPVSVGESDNEIVPENEMVHDKKVITMNKTPDIFYSR